MSARALVVGAGPAGLAAAAGLAGWCRNVTVVEARPSGRLRHAGEHLTPAGVVQLARAGFEALLDDRRHGRSPGVRSVWGTDTPCERAYLGALPGYGLNLHRDAFDTALADHVACRGAALLFATRLTAITPQADTVTATIAGPDGRRHLTADLVIDASGRRAAAVRRLGGRRRRLDALVGVCGVVRAAPETTDPGRLHIEAAEDGWWYAVRRPDGTLIATYMTDAANVRDQPAGARGLWYSRLRASGLTGSLAHGDRGPATITVFDAATQVLDPPPTPHVLAVGDAAHALDPLSSRGIANGVADGDAAATALQCAWRGERDAVAAHRQRQRAAFWHACEQRQQAYRAEGRWPAAPFWQQRRGDAAHVAA